MQRVKEGAVYLIRSRQSGMLLGVEGDPQKNGALLQLVDPNRTVEGWKLEKAEGELFRLQYGATGKVMDIIDGGAQDGSWLHLWEQAAVESQLWRIVPVGEGCKILSHQGDKCLDVVGLSQEEGAHLQIWEDLDGENQQWVLELMEEQAKRPEQPEQAQPQKESCPQPQTVQPKAGAKDAQAKEEREAAPKKSAKAAKGKAGAKKAPKKK